MFFNNLINPEFKLKLLVFFKKTSSFLNKKNYKSSVFHKAIVSGKKKKITLSLKPQKQNYRENRYTVNSKLLKVVFSNRKVFKLFFFKKHSKQKNITKFIQHISQKKQYVGQLINNYISFVLIRSHFFFFLEDVNFFLKKNLVLVNGVVVKNRFFELKPNDCVQLVNSDYYFDYIFYIYKFFRKKIKKMKYNRWKGIQRKKMTGQFFKNWLPNFLDKFSFYRNEIPKFLEVDFFSLTIIYLYKSNSILSNDTLLLKIFSSYLLKMYNWRVK